MAVCSFSFCECKINNKFEKSLHMNLEFWGTGVVVGSARLLIVRSHTKNQYFFENLYSD